MRDHQWPRAAGNREAELAEGAHMSKLAGNYTVRAHQAGKRAPLAHFFIPSADQPARLAFS